MADQVVEIDFSELGDIEFQVGEIDVNLPPVQLQFSRADKKIYLAGQALSAMIRNQTDFADGRYPYDKVAAYCCNWAEAVLQNCGE